MAYNGWKNRETWNVALWIGNDEGAYRQAMAFMKTCKSLSPYRDFAKTLPSEATPDGVKWLSGKLGYKELNAFMRELRDTH